jgi:hypothetical protein
MTENFLYKAVFISLAAHTAIVCLLYWNRLNDRHFQHMRRERVEISYQPHYRKKSDIHEYPIKPAQHLDFNNGLKFLSDGSIPVSLVKEKSELPFGMLQDDGSRPMRNMELSRRISIVPITSEKINNPVYAAYNDMVRERIKERVYANYDRMESGVVYLTFLVDNHGMLEEARIIPEKTNASAHLQQMALKSLMEASPFPAFLKGMNLTEYPFNIQIQYQVSGD